MLPSRKNLPVITIAITQISSTNEQDELMFYADCTTPVPPNPICAAEVSQINDNV